MPGDGPKGARASAPRLRRSSEIQRVLAGGRRLHGERVTVCLARGEGASRGAWVAGRKVGGAVARNRARRLLREAWWELGSALEGSWDLVLVARPGIREATADEVKGEVRGVLERAGIA